MKDILIETTEKVIDILQLDDSNETFDSVETWIMESGLSIEEVRNPELVAEIYKRS